MKKFFNILWMGVFILLTQSCDSMSHLAPQDDCGFVLNAFSQRISLKNKKLKFFIHSSVPEKFHDSIMESSSWWNEALGTQKLIVQASAPKGIDPLAKDGHSVISIRSEWDPGRSREQGRTVLYWLGDQIIEADIILNGKDFSFFVEEEDVDYRYGSKIHFASLTIHEKGHAMGFDHKKTRGNVMAPFLRAGEVRNKLTPSTLSSLRCEYGS